MEREEARPSLVGFSSQAGLLSKKARQSSSSSSSSTGVSIDEVNPAGGVERAAM